MPKTPPHDRYDARETAQRIEIDEALRRARHFFPAREPRHVVRLAGGFSNANFLVDYGASRILLRLFPAGAEVAQREAAVLGLAGRAGLKVPRVLDLAVDSAGAAAAMEFVSGSLLSVLLESEQRPSAEIFANVGRELARIHSVTFPQGGIFSAAGEVRPFKEFPEAGLDFIRQFLDGLAGKRLGPDLTSTVRDLAEREWCRVRKTFRKPSLVHCDFNPKNILVRDNEVAAVVDWEFAIAGDPLIDLGNFFRFADDYAQPDSETLLAAYAAAGGHLPEDWRKSARLHDLVSLCAFLADKEERPKTFRTARARIEETIEEFLPD